GGELVAALVLELLHGAHQADVPFLDEVEEAEAAVRVPLGDRDDQAKVGLDQPALSFLCLGLTAPDDAQHVAQRVRRHPNVFRRLLEASPRLLYDLPTFQDLTPRRVDHTTGGLPRALPPRLDTARMPDALGARVAEPILEPAHRELVAVDRPVRL